MTASTATTCSSGQGARQGPRQNPPAAAGKGQGLAATHHHTANGPLAQHWGTTGNRGKEVSYAKEDFACVNHSLPLPLRTGLLRLTIELISRREANGSLRIHREDDGKEAQSSHHRFDARGDAQEAIERPSEVPGFYE